jgi:hypothetical protein
LLLVVVVLVLLLLLLLLLLLGHQGCCLGVLNCRLVGSHGRRDWVWSVAEAGK